MAQAHPDAGLLEALRSTLIMSEVTRLMEILAQCFCKNIKKKKKKSKRKAATCIQ
jgi:hypothetical protein